MKLEVAWWTLWHLSLIQLVLASLSEDELLTYRHPCLQRYTRLGLVQASTRLRQANTLGISVLFFTLSLMVAKQLPQLPYYILLTQVYLM